LVNLEWAGETLFASLTVSHVSAEDRSAVKLPLFAKPPFVFLAELAVAGSKRPLRPLEAPNARAASSRPRPKLQTRRKDQVVSDA
jgi:hypothetical protein